MRRRLPIASPRNKIALLAAWNRRQNQWRPRLRAWRRPDFDRRRQRRHALRHNRRGRCRRPRRAGGANIRPCRKPPRRWSGHRSFRGRKVEPFSRSCGRLIGRRNQRFGWRLRGWQCRRLDVAAFDRLEPTGFAIDGPYSQPRRQCRDIDCAVEAIRRSHRENIDLRAAGWGSCAGRCQGHPDIGLIGGDIIAARYHSTRARTFERRRADA